MTNRSAHFDEIEHLLREALGDYAPPAPERVWKRVEARLPKRRRPLIGWWLAGIGLAAVVLGGLAVQAARQKPPTPAKPQASTRVMDNEVTSSEQALQLDGGQNGNQPLKPSESARQGVSVFRPEEVAKEKEASTGSDNDSQTIVLADEQPAMPQPANQTPINAIESNRFDPLAMLLLPETTVGTTTPPPAFPPVEIARNKRNGRWSVGIHAAPVWQWQQESFGIDQTGHIQVAEQTQNPSAGLQLGASVSYQLNPRWRLETGLWQQTLSRTFSHTATLRLMDGVCLNPNDPGLKQYEFHYAIQSDGSGPTTVTVRMEENDPNTHIASDEPFAVEMQTTHRSTEWLVPLSAQRLIGQGRWKGALRGGMVTGFSGRTNIQVEHFAEDCTALYFSNDYKPVVTTSNRQNISLRYLLGAGMEYRLAPRWRLTVESLLTGRKEQTAVTTNAGLYFDF